MLRARGIALLSDWGLSQLFNIRYLSSGFERGYKQEERENTHFYFCDFGKCCKAAVLWVTASLYKVVLRITHSGRSNFMFLLPVVLKPLRLLFKREQSVLHTTCVLLWSSHVCISNVSFPQMEKFGESITMAAPWSALQYLHSLALLDAEPAPDMPAVLVSLGDLPFIRLS